MRNYLPVMLMLIVLSACAAPAPTAPPKPTSAPVQTLVPAASATVAAATPKPPVGPTLKPAAAAPTSQSIAVQNLKQAKQPDGSVLTTANITAPENLGLGQMELASPDAMMLSETRTIRLRLSPAQQLVSLTPVAAPGKTPDIPNFVYRFSGNVQLYPIMFAELRALTFDVDQKGPVRRIVESNKPVEWAWVVRPLAAGRQELTVELSIPIIVNGVNTEMSTHVLQDLTAAIQVAAQPTPPPPTQTPAPRSIAERITDSMIASFGALLAATIGVIGTILGGILALRRRSQSS